MLVKAIAHSHVYSCINTMKGLIVITPTITKSNSIFDYRDPNLILKPKNHRTLIRWYLVHIALNEQRLTNLQKGDWQHA